MNHRDDSSDRSFNPILRTKLHRPQLSADLVNRDRLIKMMNRAQELPLTLVSAPAGYGKSVLVAQWIEQLDSPIGWLSLDADDSDLRTFLEYFLAAVDDVAPDACKATRELLEAGSLASVPVLASYLLNDLDAMATPCAIVLDDYHRIEALSPVQELMRRILEHPPQQFRFIILTRHDPPLDLPSLRAGHSINDVRLQDLRFTAIEIFEFLTAAQDRSISEEAVKTLDLEVEGWAAGLRLVALALRHVDEPDAFFKRLQGGLPQVQEYLLCEVLDAQSVEVRGCLLASAILDRFCVELLDSICVSPELDDHPEFTASDFLEELQRNNLFTISLDAGGKWFRYHHLFQDLLSSELQREHAPDFISALHLRANRWFEGESLIDEALKHALAAGDMERSVELVARHRHAALDANEWFVLANWLSLIPETVLLQRAELVLARAWILLNYVVRIESVPALLDQAESLIGEDPGEEELLGELALCRGYLLWLMGDGAGSLRYMEEALKKIPVTHLENRSNTEVIFAVSSQMVGKRDQAIRFLDDGLAHCDPRQEVRRTRLLFAQVVIHVMEGELPAAELVNRRLLEAVERGGSPYTRAWADYLQGVLHLNRCEWEAAVEYLERSVARRFIQQSRAAADSIVSLMLAYQALGREEKALEAMQILRDYVAPRDDPALDMLMMSGEARFAILQGRLEPARRWLAASEPPAEGSLVWWMDIPSITRCRAMIAVGSTGRLRKAVAQLNECAEVNKAHHNAFQLVKVLTLLALACEKQGKTEKALGILERAVTMARKGGLLLQFVELGIPMVDLLNKLSTEDEFVIEIERLVNTFGSHSSSSTAGDLGAGRPSVQKHEGQHMVAGRNHEELTNRELDILDLLAQRLRNKEISARLNISCHTVDSHLKQIYRKLGVHGRRKAVEEATKSGILTHTPAE